MTDQRTWVFVANRTLNDEEVIRVNDALNAFVSNWKTHGTPIDASGFCFEKAVIVIVANEAEVRASGCSIDKIIHFVRSLGDSLGIDFFDRFNVLCKNVNGEWLLDRYHKENASVSINSMIHSYQEFIKKAGE
jgi:hypothetical protein